jgi:hypothetical protein
MCPQVCECEVVFWSIKLPYLMQSVFKLHPEFDSVVAEVRHGHSIACISHPNSVFNT